MKFVDKHIEVDPPKNPKKITGTRFGAILGVNPWATPFQMWCEITRTYQKPFEDNIYTIAGKTIEPKQAEYMKENYFMENLVTPSSRYGKDYFKTMKGDFFHENKVFGGMWDYLDLEGDDATISTVLEMKTTKRAEDWVGKEPEYYALQVALYGYLLYTDNVCLVCSVLDEEVYNNPSAYEPSLTNTFVRPFEISSRYPDFEDLVKQAEDWYEKYVLTGISPDYDEKADAEYLEALRTKVLEPDADIAELEAEAEELLDLLDALKQSGKVYEDRLKLITDEIKARMKEQFTEDTDKVSLTGKGVVWTLSKSETKKVDEPKLKRDGIYNLYLKTSTTYTLRHKEKKDE